MQASVPIIYAKRDPQGSLSILGRAVALGVAAGALAVLVIAAWLTPDAAGIGSHRQLGLDACQFEIRTGLPCPTCGMTTSFSHFARGHIPASLYVQPMGTVLALATGMAFWAALYVALTGRAAHRLARIVPGTCIGLLLCGGIILGWAWKIWVRVRGIDGWGA